MCRKVVLTCEFQYLERQPYFSVILLLRFKFFSLIILPFVIYKPVWSHLAMGFWSILIVCSYNGLLWFKWSLFPLPLRPHLYNPHLVSLTSGMFFGHCSKAYTLGAPDFSVVSTWNTITPNNLMNYSLFIHVSHVSSHLNDEQELFHASHFGITFRVLSWCSLLKFPISESIIWDLSQKKCIINREKDDF